MNSSNWPTSAERRFITEVSDELFRFRLGVVGRCLATSLRSAGKSDRSEMQSERNYVGRYSTVALLETGDSR